jgi:hypothetical protein
MKCAVCGAKPSKDAPPGEMPKGWIHHMRRGAVLLLISPASCLLCPTCDKQAKVNPSIVPSVYDK